MELVDSDVVTDYKNKCKRLKKYLSETPSPENDWSKQINIPLLLYLWLLFI